LPSGYVSFLRDNRQSPSILDGDLNRDPALLGQRFSSWAFMRKAVRLTGRVAVALGLVAAITLIFSRVAPVNATTVGFFYLVAILFIATAGGLVESTIASVAAMLCFNFFFLPPVGTFTIADPQNWVALFAFLATSLTASQLSARAKRRTGEVVARQREIERLYSISRSLLLSEPTRSTANEIVQQIAQVFEFRGVALYDRKRDETYQAAMEDVLDVNSRLRESALRSTVFRDENDRLLVTPIRLGGQPIGSLALRGESLSDAALQSLLNLVAIGLERSVSQEAVTRAEVARQSEELKSTLLDAIAHEFKTPLTSIKAVTTDLLSDPDHPLQQHQRELISIADEGADRLSKLVTDAIQLARIEGGTFRLNRGVHFPASLIAGALRQMKSLIDLREIAVSAADDVPLVWVDADLVQMVIAHLIENALKYSPPGTPISIGARAHENKVIICVADRGPGITEAEQQRIFEKFYRGRTERSLKGTGMGLAIAREIIRAHGEEIWVTSRPGEGSEFCFSLPVAQRGEAE
jgi:two-component system, OmpR family, sensor histidine kinase KdpD